MQRRLFFLVLIALMASFILGAAEATSISGSLTINGKRHPLTNAYLAQPEPKEKAQLIVSTVALSKEEQTDIFALMHAARDKGVHALKFDLDPENQGASWQVITDDEGSLSASVSPSPFKIEKFTKDYLSATAMREPDKIGEITYSFEFTVAGKIEPPHIEPAPTAADTAKAQTHPAAKAYLAYLAALRAGSKAGLEKIVVPENVGQMNTPDFPKMLAMIQMMEPKQIKILKATEDGDVATLVLTGVLDGKPQKGTATMKKINGQWLMAGEAWKGSM